MTPKANPVFGAPGAGDDTINLKATTAGKKNQAKGERSLGLEVMV